MRIRYLFFGSVLVVIVTALLLITGSPILTKSTPGLPTVPLGTFITWVGLISLPYAIFWGNGKLRTPHSKFEKTMNKVLLVSFLTAAFWVPVSYLLAGNMSFSFTEKTTFQGGQSAMKTFWSYTYFVVGLPLIILLILGLNKLANRSKS